MVEIENLYKKFGKNEVLNGIDLTIKKVEFLLFLDQMVQVKLL